MKRVKVLAIYYEDSDKKRLDKLLKPLTIINGWSDGEITEPYDGLDYEDLFHRIHEKQLRILVELEVLRKLRRGELNEI